MGHVVAVAADADEDGGILRPRRVAMPNEISAHADHRRRGVADRLPDTIRDRAEAAGATAPRASHGTLDDASAALLERHRPAAVLVTREGSPANRGTGLTRPPRLQTGGDGPRRVRPDRYGRWPGRGDRAAVRAAFERFSGHPGEHGPIRAWRLAVHMDRGTGPASETFWTEVMFPDAAAAEVCRAHVAADGKLVRSLHRTLPRHIARLAFRTNASGAETGWGRDDSKDGTSFQKLVSQRFRGPASRSPSLIELRGSDRAPARSGSSSRHSTPAGDGRRLGRRPPVGRGGRCTGTTARPCRATPLQGGPPRPRCAAAPPSPSARRRATWPSTTPGWRRRRRARRSRAATYLS